MLSLCLIPGLQKILHLHMHDTLEYGSYTLQTILYAVGQTLPGCPDGTLSSAV